nr:PREDICTED: uncharacterized protein LOC108221070 [Daucus carota subsp. sativus]
MVVKGATRIILAALSLASESMQAEGCWIHFYKDSAENIKKSRTNSPGIANVESSLKDNGGYSRSPLSKVVQNSPYAFLVETTNKVCKDIPQSGTQLRRNYGHDIASQITNRGLERTPLSVTGGSTLSPIATSIGERSTPGTSLTNETTKTTGRRGRVPCGNLHRAHNFLIEINN